MKDIFLEDNNILSYEFFILIKIDRNKKEKIRITAFQ